MKKKKYKLLYKESWIEIELTKDEVRDVDKSLNGILTKSVYIRYNSENIDIEHVKDIANI